MIGIFDSGNGGLTVLAAAKKHLPQQDFLYLGDHARAPYGGKSHADILAHTTEMGAHLFREGCDLVILACNTASAVALRSMQENWLPSHAPNKRVLGVLVPMVEAITGMEWNRHKPGQNITPPHRIGIFATETTVQARSYVEEVEKRSPNAKVFQQACPSLAQAIEANIARDEMSNLVKGFVSQLMDKADGKIDNILLGCTHYPLVEEHFKRHLPDTVKLYSQGQVVAEALSHYLDRHPTFMATAGEPQPIRFLTTAKPDTIAPIKQFIPGFDPKFEQI